MREGLVQDPMGSKWLTGDSNSGLFGVKARSKSKGQRATAWGNGRAQHQEGQGVRALRGNERISGGAPEAAAAKVDPALGFQTNHRFLAGCEDTAEGGTGVGLPLGEMECWSRRREVKPRFYGCVKCFLCFPLIPPPHQGEGTSRGSPSV